MEAIVDPYYYDKEFLQGLGFRYILSNEFQTAAETRVRQWIEDVHYNGSPDGVGPSCHCQNNRSGVKCNDCECSLRPRKIECPAICGLHCQNRTLTKGINPDFLQIRAADGIGFVLVATRRLHAKEPIIEYVGLMQEGQLRFGEPYCYPLQRFHGRFHIHITQVKQANESRYICHSENPNCDIEEWICGKTIRLLVVANKSIPAEEILTISFPQKNLDKQNLYLPTQNVFAGEFDVEAKVFKETNLKYRQWKETQNKLDDTGNKDTDTSGAKAGQKKGRKIAKKGEKLRKCPLVKCKFSTFDEAELVDHMESIHSTLSIPDEPTREPIEETCPDTPTSSSSSDDNCRYMLA